MAEQQDVLRELRRHHEGTLVFDGHASPSFRFVIDHATGVLVGPVEPVVLTASDHTLFVPEERDGAVELMLEVALADSLAGPLASTCDRWLAYHGRTALQSWSAAAIAGAKWREDVFDGGDLMHPNPLRAETGRLCRVADTDREALSAACRRRAGVEVAEPVVVGVDPWGVDVRARFGIVRLEFDAEAATPDEAEAAIRLMMSDGGGL